MNFLKLICCLGIMMCTYQAQTQSNLWKKVSFNEGAQKKGKRWIVPDKYLTYEFDYKSFNQAINQKSRSNQTALSIEVPDPEGNVENFDIFETPVFDEALSKKYPGYYSYTGISKSDGQVMLKFSVSPFGIHGMILGRNEGAIFIDPVFTDDANLYQVYYKKDFRKKRGNFTCGVRSDMQSPSPIVEHNIKQGSERIAGDCMLRSYRLALACTGEYSSFHGGTKEKVLAAYNNSMTRVNGLYERDLAITMKLIGDTDKLIYLQANQDPYANGNGELMLSQNQDNIDNVIGFSNYDIGHVFSTGGGGIAQLRAPCSNSKAEGVTGQETPIGDPFDIDYVAHEMGHQFGANHTQNNQCQRNNNTAMEPGSGSTILAYAGICDPNVQNNSDDHFHAISIEEIQNFIVAGNGNTCAVRTPLDNQAPQVGTEKTSYTIPRSTPFVLTAIGQDADNDALTYCWEQINNEVATMPPSSSSTVGPMFRSLSPMTSPSRYFPDLLRRYTQWEVLSNVTRELDFVCTVRDNKIGGGCTDEVNVSVNVTNQAGPFAVLNPNASSVNWLIGSTQTVTWDVSKTDIAPINCANVDIFLSIDGGASYPHVLVNNVPNTGSASVVVPSLLTTRARVMVKAADNIFYDFSNNNFRITSTFNAVSSITQLDICNQDAFETEIALTANQAVSGPVVLSMVNLPSGLTASFSTNQLSPLPANPTLKVEGLQSLSKGSHTLTLSAAIGVEQIFIEISLFLGQTTPQIVTTIAPANSQSNVSPSPTAFFWQAVEGIKDYTLDVATFASFDPILQSVTTANANFNLNLESSKVYYWRVKANNACLMHPYSNTVGFRTSGDAEGPVVFISNELLLLNRGASAPITEDLLKVAGQNPTFILFTITKTPDHGQILINNVPLKVGDSFTMLDINEGKLSYSHNNDIFENDAFTFSVIDDFNNWSPENTFNIKIRQETLSLAVFRTKSIACFGDSDAILTAEGFGGQPPYTFSLDGVNYAESPVFENLSAGTYTVYIKDANGSIKEAQPITFISPDQIIIAPKIDNYDVIIDASGGVGTLLYSLNGIDFIPESRFLDPGNGAYVVEVKDGNNCTISAPITLDIPKLELNVVLENDVLCASAKANVVCNAVGGIPPYTYKANTTTNQSNKNFLLDAGDYVFTVVDDGGKTVVSDTVKTSKPTPIVVTLSINKFTVTANASGGTEPYQYSEDNNTFSDQNVFVFTGNGAYKIFVKDSNGCIRTTNLSLNVLTTVNKTIRDLKCYKSKDGYLRLQPTNGSFPYRYSLNGSPFSSTREWNNLDAGAYEFTIIDNKNDSLTEQIMIAQPDSLTMGLIIDGQNMVVNASGGTPPYLYSLDDGFLFLETNDFRDLDPATYLVVVKDKNNCLVKDTAAIVSSVHDLNSTKVTIFPNPTSEHLFVNLSGNHKNVMLTLATISGIDLPNIVYKRKNDALWQLEISHLAQGAYLLNIDVDGRKITKLVIKH